MSKIRIAPSGLAPHKVIYAGHVRVLKGGQVTWSDKQDVTDESVDSVFDHIIARGEAEDFNQITFHSSRKNITVTIEPLDGGD